MHLRVGRGGVDHGLLVAREVVAKRVAMLLQRLADAGDVAVAENPEHAAEKRLLMSVARGPLPREESHERLRHRQPYRAGRDHIAGSPRAATNEATSPSVGMKFAHPCRVTTMAPQALPRRAARSSGQPWR